MVKNARISCISLDGGALCLDFINTVHNRMELPRREYLLDVQDFIAWCDRLGCVDGSVSKHLYKMTLANTNKGRSFFREALALRELLYRIFHAIAVKRTISASDLALYNVSLKNCFVHLQLTGDRNGFKEEWNFPDDSLHQLTAPIMKNAHELLLSGRPERIKECPNCGWLFLDTTKNGRRRWCSMKKLRKQCKGFGMVLPPEKIAGS